jgi:hypothetical protein
MGRGGGWLKIPPGTPRWGSTPQKSHEAVYLTATGTRGLARGGRGTPAPPNNKSPLTHLASW